MTDTDLSREQDKLRSELIRSLKTFSISYEQQQLLHRPDFGYLVHHLIRKRRFLTSILFFVSALLFAQAVIGFVSGAVYLPWLLILGFVGGVAYRRRNKTKTLVDAFAAYESSRMNVDSIPPTLGDELRLNFSFAYNEHQAIKAGHDLLVANRLIIRRQINSVVFGIGAIGLSQTALRRNGTDAIPFVVIIVGGTAVCFVRDC